MKKFTFIFLAAIMVLSLAACGNGQKETKETTQNGGTEPAQTTQAQEGGEGYTFTYKGVKLFIGEDASVIEEFGEPKSYTESKSCGFEGLDKESFFGSFYVTSSELNGSEFISSFYFVDDTVETDEGLCIGDSKSKVEELYGADGYNGSNAYFFNKDKCKLTIILEGDSVSSIQYAYEN